MLRENLTKLYLQPVNVSCSHSLEVKIFLDRLQIFNQIIWNNGRYQIWIQAQMGTLLQIQLIMVNLADINVLCDVGNKGIENKTCTPIL